MQNKFYNSKLNTALLLVLIVLMMIALCWMYKNMNLYISSPSNSTPAIYQEPQVEGNKEDLVSFSIKPGQEVSGKMKVMGTLKGGYFFEANLLVGILDVNKKLTSYGPGHANATTDWMTAGPVSFAFDIDFSLIPRGNYYIKLTQDDPSDGESGKPIKYVIIPIAIKDLIIIDQKVATEFGDITIPRGWKAQQGCYKDSYAVIPRSITEEMPSSIIDDLCGNYVTIGSHSNSSSCDSYTSKEIYCKEGKMVTITTKHPELRVLVDSLFEELK